jgi:exopolysaccharide production protein ExoQ
MPRLIATLVCVVGIFGLFKLNRDRSYKTSGALWLPVIWLAVAGSREVSQWLSAFGLGFGSGGSLTPHSYLEGSPVDRFLSLVLTILAVGVLVHRQHRIGKFFRANFPILLFFFYCALSIVWSDYPDVAFKRWIKAIGDLAMVLVVLTDLDQLAAVRRLFSRVGFILLPFSILFIKYYPWLGRTYSNWFGQAVYVGVTQNKNTLGMITLLLGLACVWSFFQAFEDRRRTRKSGPLVAQGVLLAMVIWLFWMARSATSLSCFLMASAFLAATRLSRFGRKPAAAHLFALAVVTVSVIALFFDPGGDLVATMGRDATLTGRTDIWRLVLSMSGNPLVGTGFESFWLGSRLEKVWNVYRFHLNESHNGYLEVYVNLGWVGVTLLALLLVTGYRNLLSAFRRDPYVGSLKLAFFVAAVVYNLAEAGFRVMNPMWIVFLLAIIAIPDTTAQERPPLIRVDQADDFARGAPQLDHVLSSRFREEAN